MSEILSHDHHDHVLDAYMIPACYLARKCSCRQFSRQKAASRRHLPGTFRVWPGNMEIEKSQPVMEKKHTNIRTRSMEVNATQLKRVKEREPPRGSVRFFRANGANGATSTSDVVYICLNMSLNMHITYIVGCMYAQCCIIVDFGSKSNCGVVR